jgi:hypothetical protein
MTILGCLLQTTKQCGFRIFILVRAGPHPRALLRASRDGLWPVRLLACIHARRRPNVCTLGRTSESGPRAPTRANLSIFFREQPGDAFRPAAYPRTA